LSVYASAATEHKKIEGRVRSECGAPANTMSHETSDIPPNEESSYEQVIDYHSIFQDVLWDLVRVTHCHGCGRKKNVCFFGYVGEYCSKYCYKASCCHDEVYESRGDDSIGHDPETCGWCCGCYPLSRANTLYHQSTHRHRNPSGEYWPMLDYRLPCYNDIIRTKRVVCIPGYNDGYFPPNYTGPCS